MRNKISSFGSYGVALLLLSSLAASCHHPAATGSATKDIATDSGGNGTSLYYREGAKIRRMGCPNGTLSVNLKRDHCTDDLGAVSAARFIADLSNGVGATVADHAKNVQDFYTGIASTQNELLQILAAAPSVQAQVASLRQSLDSSEVTIAARQVQLDGLAQQAAAIQARLASHGDIDLSMQLGALLDQRAALWTQQSLALSDQQKSRDALIVANSSSLDPATYNDVKAQMDAEVQQLDSERDALTAAMQEVSDLNKTVAHLTDPAFTFNVIEGLEAFGSLKPFTRRFQAIFAYEARLDQVAAAQAAADQAAAAQAAAAQAAAAQEAAARAAAAQAAAAQAASERAAADHAAAILAATTPIQVRLSTIRPNGSQGVAELGFKVTSSGVLCMFGADTTTQALFVPFAAAGTFACDFVGSYDHFDSTDRVAYRISGVVSAGLLNINTYKYTSHTDYTGGGQLDDEYDLDPSAGPTTFHVP